MFDGIKTAALAIPEERKAAGVPIAVYQDEGGTTHGTFHNALPPLAHRTDASALPTNIRFAARPDLHTPEIEAAFEQSVEQTVDWFKVHL
jgi:hypothetical protein